MINCELCSVIENPYRILYKNDLFTLTCALGSISIEDYLLLVLNKHIKGMSNLSIDELILLDSSLSNIKKELNNKHNKDILIFEHGPNLGCSSGGGCIEHAHFHILPFDYRIKNDISDSLGSPVVINSYSDFAEYREESYVFIEEANKKYIWYLDNIVLPKQYIRQILGYRLNTQRWDWVEHPDYRTFRKNHKRLRNTFDSL